MRHHPSSDGPTAAELAEIEREWPAIEIKGTTILVPAAPQNPCEFARAVGLGATCVAGLAPDTGSDEFVQKLIERDVDATRKAPDAGSGKSGAARE